MSNRPYRNGVLTLLIAGSAPLLFLNPLFAAENPIEVRSLSSSSSTTGSGEIAFQAPVEEEVEPGMEGIETQYQLQLLQQEVQTLRGLVEELTYQVERMRETQEDRYLELDSRVQSLINTGAAGGFVAGTEPDIADVTAEPEIVSGSQNEKALYETALELIRNRQYDLAITQLQAVIAQYPDGDFTANAYYWLGEVYAAKPEPDYENARQALAQVITFFPDNRKVPDAAFKLGKVYHLMGDCDRATELLRQVAREHQGKSVAKLADAYLRDKVNCGN